MVRRVVRSLTLTFAVADSIRENIFQGGLQPWEPLREVDLSASLNVSRGTIRGALRILCNGGLVEIIPHRGAFVRGLSLQTAIDTFTLHAERCRVSYVQRHRAIRED
jgi:DNA-binding GntR family transcriptional regulator